MNSHFNMADNSTLWLNNRSYCACVQKLLLGGGPRGLLINLQQSFLQNTKFKLLNFGTAYVEFFFLFLEHSYYNYWYYIFYIIIRHFLKETSFV